METEKVLEELKEVRIEKLTPEAKRLFNAIMLIADERDIYKKQLNDAFDKGWVHKDKIKKIVNECLEKKPNVITGKEEYCFNTNDNSFLAHKIVEILEEK